MVDYAFMSKVDKFMRHGRTDVPEYMISTSRGDYTGISKIHFFYSSSEVLYAALFPGGEGGFWENCGDFAGMRGRENHK